MESLDGFVGSFGFSALEMLGADVVMLLSSVEDLDRFALRLLDRAENASSSSDEESSSCGPWPRRRIITSFDDSNRDRWMARAEIR